MSAVPMKIAISISLANRSGSAGLLSFSHSLSQEKRRNYYQPFMPPAVHTAQHPHFFSFFLNNPLILGADAARNFSEKNRTT